MNTNQIYTSRYIAFIDILGFRDAVKKSEQDQILREKIISALRNLNSIKNFVDQTNKDLDQSRNGQITKLWFQPTIQVFSDSIYISIHENPSALSMLGAYCTLIYGALFSSGLFARGAITKGNSFESEDTIFGQGLIDAYDLESKTAIYPRILVSNTILDDVKTTGNFHLEKDFDGLHYIDVFYEGIQKMLSNWEAQSGIKMDLSTGRQRLEEEYLSNNNQSCKAKLYWLIEYFNKKTENHKLHPIEII